MNIILFAFIFIIIVSLIYHYNNNTIENITNINSIDIKNNILPNEINMEPIYNIELQKELIYQNNTFRLIGTAINKPYNQKYYLYESKINQNDNLLNEQLYNYIFVNFLEQPIIQQEFGPRNKIDVGDIIYLFNGINNIGPYIII